MEDSDGEKGNNVNYIDEILEPEDLFIDEAEDEEDKDHKKATEKTEEYSEEKSEKKVKKPRVVKKARVTLNFDTLRGNNGLSTLKKLFENFKFKGNGHEKEDLTKIMAILQQWMCYQLCPGYNFESTLSQLEALGKKKVVQTLMKKYRLKMDEWGENNDGESTAADNKMEISDTTARDEFYQLLDEEITNAKSDCEFSEAEDCETQNNIQSVKNDQETILTLEQLEQIARNKKLAEERRNQRMSMQCLPKVVCQQQEKVVDQEISLENINLGEDF